MHSSQMSSIPEIVGPLLVCGMDTSDISRAESCLRQACTMLQAMAKDATNDASKHPWEQQQRLLSTSISLIQTYLRARLRLGQIYSLTGRLGEAFLIFREIVQAEQSGPTLRSVAWYDLGVIFLASNQPDQALQAFQQSVQTPQMEHIQHGFDGLDGNAFMRYFVPGALSQLENAMDCLEQQQPPSADSFRWSLQLISNEKLSTLMGNSSSRNQQESEEINSWAAGAA